MRIDYLHPVVGPRMLLEGRVLHRGRRSHLVEVRILDEQETALVHALVTMLESG
jgi:acyl-coenzyme A thioesterase PaaI-like protein